MLNFKRITPEDKEIFDSFYKYKDVKNCETAFANLCAYGFALNGEYAIIDNTLVTRVHFELNKVICYHCPIGAGDPRVFLTDGEFHPCAHRPAR